jgi:hypothetical protein
MRLGIKPVRISFPSQFLSIPLDIFNVGSKMLLLFDAFMESRGGVAMKFNHA